ncbi:MAG: DUF927 domain-containing protein, partial [Acidobacteriota bacterium]
KDASRMHYLPAIASKGAPFEFRNLVGDLLDWRAIDLRDGAPKPTAQKMRQSSYADAAINGEVSRVLSAPQGDRNNALNKAAYYLGRLVGGGVLDQAEVTDALTDAALQAGLEEGETNATINSGLTAGAKKPRNPQMNGSSGASAQSPTQSQGHTQGAATGQSRASSKGNSNSSNGSANQNSNVNSNAATAQNTAQAGSNGKRIGAYEETPGGLIYWQQTTNGEVEIALSNFCSEIIADVIEDDGAEQRRAFEVKALLNGKAAQFLVLAEDFGAMKWPMTNLGAKAVIYPRRTDHARCAIQMLSPQPVERRIFTHTGWRDIDGEKVYLHGGGAIGAQSVKDVEVRLPDSLQLASLPEPPNDEVLKDAISAILALTRLAADEITLPVIGAAFSAVIGGADFSIWLYGATGSGKSQLAALVQSFFGRFNADRLPGSWMSTANALEVIAHAAKDMIFVVDDFKPTGGANDRNRLMRDADRLLRAQGNQHGRQRLAADTTQRKTKHPRGLIFNTAEEVPRGESLIARLFVIETQMTSIDFSQLSKFQGYAANGIFASAMSGFLRWLAANHSEAIERAPKEIARWRDDWAGRHIAGHRRYATTLGHLTYAWSLWLRFVQEAGAMTEAEAVEIEGRVSRALGLAGSKQDAHTNAQNPVTRFSELLENAFASQNAHLESINGGAPVNATAWGWRRTVEEVEEEIIDPDTGIPKKLKRRVERHAPLGDLIGWHAGAEIYILADATFSLLERFSANGEGIGVQQKTLWKHLHEAGILIRSARDEARRTYIAQRTVNGKKIGVVVLRAEKLFTYADSADSADTEGG